MAQWLRENPWRQGHVLTSETAFALGLSHPQSPGATAIVVISHDCDLAQEVDVEPTCEVVIGRKIAGLDGNFANAKSVRRLHLEFTVAGSGEIVVELDSASKSTIRKEHLASHAPDASLILGVSEGTILRTWLAARYRRAAFADEFDKRLTRDGKKAYSKLLKIFKESSEDIIAVFFDVDQGSEVDRKGANDLYELSVYLLYSVERDPKKAKATAERAAADIDRVFRDHFCPDKKWQNIELLTCEPISEDAMTVRQDRILKRWNLDYVSLKEDQPVLN